MPTPSNCIPGCGWAPYEWCPYAKPWRCAWPPDKLDQMLATHVRDNPRDHNEVVLDASTWTSQLPRTIEAIWFFEEANPSEELDRAMANAVDVHRRFLWQYDLSSASVPLLSFDPTRAPPFACYACG